jgi:hypothetical protein
MEVAFCEFLLCFPNGRKKRVRARLGKPYQISSGIWACPVGIRGFEKRYPDIRGVDSMQAICLAASLIRMRFEDFFLKGGKVLGIKDGSERDLRSVMSTFGVVRSGDAV